MVKRLISWIRYRLARKQVAALKLSIRELQTERRRLIALRNEVPITSSQFKDCTIRIKAIDDHLYRVFQAVASK